MTNPPIESLVADALGAPAGVGNRSDWSFLSESSLSTARSRAGRQRSLLAGACALAALVLALVVWGELRARGGVAPNADGQLAESRQLGGSASELALPRVGEVLPELLGRLAPFLVVWIIAMAGLWWAVGRYRKRRVSRPLGKVAKSALAVLSSLVVVAGAYAVAFDVYFTASGSMLPTLLVEDRMLVDPSDTEPEIGDVVIYDDLRRTVAPLASVGRVVALGGDRIEGRDGQLLVNGEPSRWLSDWPGRSLADFEQVFLGSGEMFVMGDNHIGSTDSRWTGPVPERSVLGTVRAIIWSPRSS